MRVGVVNKAVELEMEEFPAHVQDIVGCRMDV